MEHVGPYVQCIDIIELYINIYTYTYTYMYVYIYIHVYASVNKAIIFFQIIAYRLFGAKPLSESMT